MNNVLYYSLATALSQFKVKNICCLTILFCAISLQLNSQMSALAPNVKTPFIEDNLGIDVNFATGGTPITTSTSNPENVINTSLTDDATLNILVAGDRWIEVIDPNATGAEAFQGGSYAGVVISDNSLLALLGSYTLTTYLNDTLQQQVSSGSLLSTGIIIGQSSLVGFVTDPDEPFNRIRFTYSGLGAISVDVYYFMVQRFEEVSSPTCNAYTAWANNGYPVAINNDRTNVTGINLSTLQNTDAIVSPSASDFAAVTPGVLAVLGTANISVESQIGTMPAGYLTGFELENTALLGVDLLTDLRITTYLDGSPVEDSDDIGLLAGVDLLDGLGSERFKLSMLTTQPFDEVQLTISIPVGVDLGTTRIFNAFIKSFCEGPLRPCNTMTLLDESVYPVYYNSSVGGLLCVGCDAEDLDHIVDGNPSTFADIDITAAVGAGMTLSYINPLTPYPANYFVGFDIETNPLVSVDVLNFIEIQLLNNGTEVLDANDAGLLAGVSTLLLTGTSNRSIIGFVSPVAFDEVRITFNNTVGVNLGQIHVYDLVIQRGCEVVLDCGSKKALTGPEFPTVINFERTGTFGVACVGCEVDDPWDVISESLTDFATINTTVGALAAVNLSVLDPINTYHSGTYTGFVVRDGGWLIDALLLSGISVSTYNNGVLQESATTSSLLGLNLLGILTINDPGDDAYTIGFKTTKPFDEITLTVPGTVSLFGSLDVFYAFIDNSEAGISGGSVNSICFRTNPDFNATFVSVPANGDVSNNDLSAGGPIIYDLAGESPENPPGGNLTLNDDGTYTFVSATPGVYTYYIHHCSTVDMFNCPIEQLQITVNDPTSTANPPIVNPDIASVTGHDDSPPSVTIPILDNDSGGNAGSSLSDPIIGSVPPQNGTVNFVDGEAIYTPDPGFYGVDSFTYIVCDDIQITLCGETVVAIHVYPAVIENSIIVSDDFMFLPPGGTNSHNVLLNDIDPEGHSLSVTPDNQNNPGTVSMILNSNGDYTLVAGESFSGNFQFLINVQDNGTPSAQAFSNLYVLVGASSPLPLTLLSFTAKLNGNLANLNWITSHEQNIDEYGVEHSIDAKNWASIGSVNAVGNSSNTTNYAYIHTVTNEGMNYYRLRILEMNDGKSYSVIRSVNYLVNSSISISPNPVSDRLILNGAQPGDEVTIYNNQGKIMCSKTIESRNETLYLDSLISGLYQVSVIRTTQPILQTKFLKTGI